MYEDRMARRGEGAGGAGNQKKPQISNSCVWNVSHLTIVQVIHAYMDTKKQLTLSWYTAQSACICILDKSEIELTVKTYRRI